MISVMPAPWWYVQTSCVPSSHSSSDYFPLPVCSPSLSFILITLLSLSLFLYLCRAEGKQNRTCPPRVERESELHRPSWQPPCRPPSSFFFPQSSSCLSSCPTAPARVRKTSLFRHVPAVSVASVYLCLTAAMSLLSWAFPLLSHQ